MPVDGWATLAVFELDTARVFPNAVTRWVHLSRDAFARAFPGPRPATMRRLPADWRADSLSDSVSIGVTLGFVEFGARLVRTADGALQGDAHRDSEGVAATPEGAERLHVPLGPVAWRRVPCHTLTLDRSYDRN